MFVGAPTRSPFKPRRGRWRRTTGRTGDDLEEPTKSRAGRRATKVDDEVLDILQRHREAQELERPSASSVSREVARNGGPRRYRARAPDVAAYCRARRPKPSKLVLVPRLGRSSRTVWRIAGRPSSSRRGCVERIPATSKCGCHTTPSISASSCRPAARSAATRHSAITGRRR